MIPDDPEWFANSGNHVISKEWTNAIERSADTGIASKSGGTWPNPTGTTMAWGGAKILFIKTPSIAAGASWSADDAFDWRNRWILVLDAQADPDAADIVGEADYTAAGTHEGTTDQAPCAFWTGAGCIGGGMPSGPYGLPMGGMQVYCHSTTHELTVHNTSGGAYYAWLVLLVSDQFPTRT